MGEIPGVLQNNEIYISSSLVKRLHLISGLHLTLSICYVWFHPQAIFLVPCSLWYHIFVFFDNNFFLIWTLFFSTQPKDEFPTYLEFYANSHTRQLYFHTIEHFISWILPFYYLHFSFSSIFIWPCKLSGSKKENWTKCVTIYFLKPTRYFYRKK